MHSTADLRDEYAQKQIFRRIMIKSQIIEVKGIVNISYFLEYNSFVLLL